MGYYTYHTLEVASGNEHLIGELRKECEDAGWSFDDEGHCEEESKWYDHQKDMEKFSKKHKDVLFTLHGEGEAAEDLWREYFWNGKSQIVEAVITYDEFDVTKLV